MGPYTKSQTATAIDDGWEIKDADGVVIAITQTEGLADGVIKLLGLDEIPGDTPMYCQNCDHHGTADDFTPDPSLPVAWCCPECGCTTEVFTVDAEEADEEVHP